MKKFFKPIAVALLAASTLTSCVDNAVSDQVNKIREAQVNLLTASVRLRNAEAAYQEEQARQMAAIADQEEIQTEEQQSNLEVTLAYNAAQLVDAQRQLEASELQLQQAIDALADYLDSQGLADATNFLNQYKTVQQNLANLYTTRAAKVSQIATAEMLLNGANIPFALLKVEFERDLATAEAKLAYDQAALAVLEAVAEDPSTVQAEIIDIDEQILVLKNDEYTVKIEQAEAVKATAEAKKKRDDAALAITTYNTAVTGIATKTAAITAQTATNTTLSAAVTTANAAATSANGVLAAATTNLNNAKAAEAAKQNLWNTAKADLDAKTNAKTVADANVVIAQANFNADNSAANQTALTNAQTAQTAAGTALNTSQTTFNDANTDLNDAKTNTATYLALYNTAVTDAATAATGVTNAQTTLATGQATLSTLTVEKADFESEKAAAQAANDDAVLNLEAYKIAFNDAQNAETPIGTALTNNTAAQTNLTTLRVQLSNYLATTSVAGINFAIEAKKDAVELDERAVAAALKALDDNEISLTEAQDRLEDLDNELELLDEDIAANLSIAAEWKAKLEAALG